MHRCDRHTTAVSRAAGRLHSSNGVSVFEAAGLVSVLIVFAAWAAWLGERTGTLRTWLALTSLTVVGGAVTIVLAAAHAFAETAVPMTSIARGVVFGWAVAVSLGTLHYAYEVREERFA